MLCTCDQFGITKENLSEPDGPPPWEEDQGGFWVQWGLADGGQTSTYDCQWDKNVFDCLKLKKYILTIENVISPQDQFLLQIKWTQSVRLTKQVAYFILYPSKIKKILKYMVDHFVLKQCLHEFQYK